MKRIMALLSVILLATSCTQTTEFGTCVGINGKQDPKLVYEYDIVNLVIGVAFAEILIPTILVLKDQTYCPVANK